MTDTGLTRLLPYASAKREVWGGTGPAGQTIDRVYVLDADVCQILFELPVGGRFTQLDASHPVYARDVVWRVVSGVFVAVNPLTGVTHRALPGDSLLFDGTVWPSGYNYGPDPVRVVELTAPSRERAGGGVDTLPPAKPQYGQEGLIGHWPHAGPRSDAEASFRLLRPPDMLWRLEGQPDPVLVGHAVSTPYLTVGEIHLLPGAQSGLFCTSATKTLLVLDGELSVQLPEESSWLEAHQNDGVYVGAGAPHRLVNLSSGPTTVLFQVVPGDEAGGNVSASAA